MSSWKVVKLELAQTSKYPNGSVSRSYLMQLPLDDEGFFDTAAHAKRPERARVKRFWSSEPDQSGYISKAAKDWGYSLVFSEQEGRDVFDLTDHPIRPDELLMLTKADGMRLPFRIVSVTPMRR